MNNTPDQMPALADSAHGHIVDAVKSAKSKLGALESAASKRLSSTQLTSLFRDLATIDLNPIKEAIDQIAADEWASIRAQEDEAKRALEEIARARELHERYHTHSGNHSALPA